MHCRWHNVASRKILNHFFLPVLSETSNEIQKSEKMQIRAASIFITPAAAAKYRNLSDILVAKKQKLLGFESVASLT